MRKNIKSIIATLLTVAMVVPTIALGNNNVTANADSLDLPAPSMTLDFERGFKQEASENGLTVVKSKERLTYEELTDSDGNYIKDENGDYIFQWTDLPVIFGDYPYNYYYKSVFGNQPTTYDDSEKGNVIKLYDSMEAEWIIKTKSDIADNIVPVYTGGFDENGYPLDEIAALESTLQEAFFAHSAAQINNPFIGINDSEEKGVSISYWVKATEELTENDNSILFSFERMLYGNDTSVPPTIETFTIPYNDSLKEDYGNWHFVTCVIKEQQIRFYIDGNTCSETISVDTDNVFKLFSSLNTDAYIGYGGHAVEDPGILKGILLDDINFYTVPLAEDQILAVYEQANEEKSIDSDSLPEPIKVFDFNFDKEHSIPEGMTVVDLYDASRAESPETIYDEEFGSVLKLGAGKSAYPSAVKFENPYKNMDSLTGATISYWVRSEETTKEEVIDGIGISFLDEPKILEHHKIQPAVQHTKTKTGLYAKLSGDAAFIAGIDSKVYESLKNMYFTSTKKNENYILGEPGYDEESALLEEQWTERLESMTQWHHITMVVKNSGITMYFDGEKLDNNLEEELGPTFYGNRFYDGYYATELDPFSHIKYLSNNQTATSIMEFLTQTDTSAYLGLMHMTGSSISYERSNTSYYDDIAFYDSSLSDKEVNKIYQDAVLKKSSLLGDVNNDKLINAEDALLILKYAAKISFSPDFRLSLADINQDQQINAADALEILKYAAKVDSILNSSN